MEFIHKTNEINFQNGGLLRKCILEAYGDNWNFRTQKIALIHKTIETNFQVKLQSNLNGSNIFGAMEIRSRHG